jgi:hypothetical protein
MMKSMPILLSLLTMLAATNAVGSTLRVRVVDENGHPVWARLEVRGRGEQMYHPDNAMLDLTAGEHGTPRFYLGSFVIQGECQLQLPPGRYRIIAEHGLEYERVERDVPISGQAITTVTLHLRPWIQMWRMGWWSGDLHVHRSQDQARDLALAEDLNFCPVITTWLHRGSRQFWLPTVWGSGSAPVIKIDDRHVLALRNAEDERGGGAWIFLMVRRPLQGWGTATWWYPSGLTFVHDARKERGPDSLYPWFDCEKAFWWEVPVMMALSTPDSLEVLPNHFMEYGIEDSEAWGHPRNKHTFPGREGWVEYVLGLYYRYLNLGFQLPASAGSASGVLPNPVGYNRVYVHFSGPFSVDKWFGALHEGQSFVTNGPMLFFNLIREGSLMKGTVEARSREPLDRIEIIANGKVIRWFPIPPGTLQYKAEFVFDPKDYSWVAARCFLRTGVTIRLAHTSPVSLQGHWNCRRDAQYFVNWMNDLINQTKADPKRFSSPEEREQTLRIYRGALAFYKQKLQWGCRAQ